MNAMGMDIRWWRVVRNSIAYPTIVTPMGHGAFPMDKRK